MAGIFPLAGAPAASATNAQSGVTTVNCGTVLFHSTNNCKPRFDPAAANAVLSELLNLMALAGHTYNCARLDNLSVAMNALIPHVDGFTILGAGTAADPWRVRQATTTLTGGIRIATNAEAAARSLGTVAVTPAHLGSPAVIGPLLEAQWDTRPDATPGQIAALSGTQQVLVELADGKIVQVAIDDMPCPADCGGGTAGVGDGVTVLGAGTAGDPFRVGVDAVLEQGWNAQPMATPAEIAALTGNSPILVELADGTLRQVPMSAFCNICVDDVAPQNAIDLVHVDPGIGGLPNNAFGGNNETYTIPAGCVGFVLVSASGINTNSNTTDYDFENMLIPVNPGDVIELSRGSGRMRINGVYVVDPSQSPRVQGNLHGALATPITLYTRTDPTDGSFQGSKWSGHNDAGGFETTLRVDFVRDANVAGC